MLKIVTILPFCLFCNAMSFTVLTCLAHANSFVCSIWISIYTSATRVFEKPCNMDVYIRPRLLVVHAIGHYFYDVQSFINVTEQPKKYTSNNQTSIKSHFMRTYIHIVDCWRSTWRTHIYVHGCWHENILVKRETVRGSICTSLVAEVQIDQVWVERIKDVYMRPWLLEQICLACKGLARCS